jgi:hypothetical protein
VTASKLRAVAAGIKQSVNGLQFMVCWLAFCALVTSDAQETKDAPEWRGRIVDTSGRPIPEAGVTVWNLRESRAVVADRSGAFDSPLDLAGGGFVIVQHKGFHLDGSVVERGAESILDIVLYRMDQRPPSLVTRPLPIDRDSRLGIARKMIEETWTQLVDSPTDPGIRTLAISRMARIDPLLVLKFIDEHPLDERGDGFLRSYAIRELVRVDVAAALEVAATIADPGAKAQALIQVALSDQIPRDRCSEILAEAVASAKSNSMPALRIAFLANVAEAMRKRGDRERWRQLVDELLADAEKLPSAELAGYAKSLVAAEVATFDFDRALGMIFRETIDHETERAYARVAFAIAPTDPERALRIAPNLKAKDPNVVCPYHNAVRVCGRMAENDWESATRLAATIDEPFEKAWALTLVADALASRDREAAGKLLEQAVDLVVEPTTEPKNDLFFAEDFLGGMLPIAEQIDPTSVRRLIWQMVLNLSKQSKWSVGHHRHTKALRSAVAIGRYDPSISKLLLQFGETRIPAPSINDFFMALILVSPDRFHGEHDNFLDAMANELQREVGLRITFLALTSDDERFWDNFSKPMYLMYRSDEFENPMN